MFIDRILDSIRCNKNEWDTVDPDLYYANDSIIGGSSIDKILSLLNNAVYFDLSNLNDPYRNKVNKGILLSDFPNVKPCFDITWYEWPEFFASTFGKTRVKTDGLLSVNGEILNGSKLNTYLFSFAELTDGYIPIGPWLRIFYNEFGIPEDRFETMFKYESPNIFWEIFSTHYGIPLLATSFLHCKNVTVQSTEPSLKLQKARERRGKLPLFTFKTLEIKPMTKILREEGESETKGLAHALHICRGHFKDFQQGPGLGKNHAHGLYWWDSQVRGNRQVGAVIKDYKVSPMGEK